MKSYLEACGVPTVRISQAEVPRLIIVFEEVGVQASMFGMGTLQQVRETTTSANEVLVAA